MKTGISLPSSMEFCHKRIIKLEKEKRDAVDLAHRLANDYTAALTKKDLEILTMCQKCRRGIR